LKKSLFTNSQFFIVFGGYFTFLRRKTTTCKILRGELSGELSGGRGGTKRHKNTQFQNRNIVNKNEENMINTTEKPFLIWEKHWLKEWSNLDVSDKKVLAALYWLDLTDEQKSEFSDNEYIELVKMKNKQRNEYINDPVKMRAHFLTEAAPLIDTMIQSALGNKTQLPDNELAVREVWGVLKDIIQTATNPAPLLDLKGQDIGDQIDTILENVSKGQIDFVQAKEYMSLVSSGFNIQKLPDIIQKLEALEGAA